MRWAVKPGYSPISSESSPQLASCKTAGRQHCESLLLQKVKGSSGLLNAELPQSAHVL